jgi:hypothetical protein
MAVGFHVNCLSRGLTARSRVDFDAPGDSRVASQVCTTGAHKTGVRRHLLPFPITTCSTHLCVELVYLVGCNAKVVIASGEQKCFDCLTIVSVNPSANIPV